MSLLQCSKGSEDGNSMHRLDKSSISMQKSTKPFHMTLLGAGAGVCSVFSAMKPLSKVRSSLALLCDFASLGRHRCEKRRHGWLDKKTTGRMALGSIFPVFPIILPPLSPSPHMCPLGHFGSCTLPLVLVWAFALLKRAVPSPWLFKTWASLS